MESNKNNISGCKINNEIFFTINRLVCALHDRKGVKFSIAILV